jgi:hypothetical protein
MEDTRANQIKNFKKTTNNVGLNDFIASNFNVETYINQLTNHKINIHPKNIFIKEFKEFLNGYNKEKKNKLENLRIKLAQYVVKHVHTDLNTNIVIVMRNNLNQILEDLFHLSNTILEQKISNNLSNILFSRLNVIDLNMQNENNENQIEYETLDESSADETSKSVFATPIALSNNQDSTVAPKRTRKRKQASKETTNKKLNMDNEEENISDQTSKLLDCMRQMMKEELEKVIKSNDTIKNELTNLKVQNQTTNKEMNTIKTDIEKLNTRLQALETKKANQVKLINVIDSKENTNQETYATRVCPPLENDQSWTAVQTRNQKQQQTRYIKRNNVLTGCNTNTKLKSYQMRASFFTSRWSNETTIEDIIKHVEHITKDKKLEINELQLNTNEYKAFKIIVDFKHLEAMYNTNNWPLNIKIKKYYERTSEKTKTSNTQ